MNNNDSFKEDVIIDEDEIDHEWKEEIKVMYKVDEIPPVLICLLLAFQHYISMFVATLTIPILLAPAICLFEDNVGKSEIIGTLFVASGLITLLQSFFGIRLPIVQAGTFALLVPTLSYLNLSQWRCPDNIVPQGYIGTNASLLRNETLIEMGSEEHREIWKLRLREIQGCIMVAALFEVFVGATGIVGFLMKYIGPITICPTVSLLGLSLFKSAASMASKHWGISVLSIFLMIVFSQYLGNVQIPCMVYSKAKGVYKQKLKIFKMFPVVFSIAITWLFCYLLTVINVFPQSPTVYGYEARTDIRLEAITASPWFRLPYPFQWGMPTVSVSGVFAIFTGVLATTIESIGDYYSCASLAGAPPPPIHAINRGILIEGLGSILDGMFGTGNGTTSTSINVGVIGITKVGSRVVIQISALFMISLGLFTKFGALFTAIPDPIIGGTFFILFGMIVAVGLSNLQHIDLNSGRNLFIIGFSLLAGLAIPQWVAANPGFINSGSEIFDNLLTVLLSTGMFVGGFLGFLFDNTIPGSSKERGLDYWEKLRKVSANSRSKIHKTSESSQIKNNSLHVVYTAKSLVDFPAISNEIKIPKENSQSKDKYIEMNQLIPKENSQSKDKYIEINQLSSRERSEMTDIYCGELKNKENYSNTNPLLGIQSLSGIQSDEEIVPDVLGKLLQSNHNHDKKEDVVLKNGGNSINVDDAVYHIPMKISNKTYLQERLAVTYDLPISSDWLSRFWIFRHLPFCPVFGMETPVSSSSIGMSER